MTAPTTTKRQLLKTIAAAGVATFAKAAHGQGEKTYDVVVIGAGTAGLPTAIFAAARGASVAVIEAASVVGGTLFLSSGQMSAAGTKLQKKKGIEDTPKLHFDDVMKISKGTADPVLVKLATDNAHLVFDWLMDSGFEVQDQHPVTGTTHEPYSRARYAWAKKDGGRAILKVLEEQLKPHIESGKVTVMTNTEAVEILKDDSDAVVGVRVITDKGGEFNVMGKNVVLTAGGYTFNPEMFRELEQAPINTNVTYPFSLGQGLRMAVAAGGYLRGGDKHTPLFGAILADGDIPTARRAMARHFPGDRPPWEIIVDSAGMRFLQEDVLSHDAYEQALGQQPKERCWIVFDAEIYAKAPKLVGGGFSKEDTDAALKGDETPFFYHGNTIEELAKNAGIDPAGLKTTVAAYNDAQAGKSPDKLGRKHMPLPIAKAPFYAIETYSWTLLSYAGVAVNGDLNVIRQDGTPIKNLYAAGELLGMGQLMGRAVCGGMSVTPALSLGRLLGTKILKV